MAGCQQTTQPLDVATSAKHEEAKLGASRGVACTAPRGEQITSGSGGDGPELTRTRPSKISPMVARSVMTPHLSCPRNFAKMRGSWRLAFKSCRRSCMGPGVAALITCATGWSTAGLPRRWRDSFAHWGRWSAATHPSAHPHSLRGEPLPSRGLIERTAIARGATAARASSPRCSFSRMSERSRTPTRILLRARPADVKCRSCHLFAADRSHFWRPFVGGLQRIVISGGMSKNSR
jgi:hypothetical protein